jgi:CBS domain-containing protein
MKILLALDGSDTAWHALSEALRILPMQAAEVVVIAVAEFSSLPSDGIGFGTEDIIGHRKAEVSLRAEAARGALEAAGVQASTILREGDAADEILACADELRPDLIVVGSHGYGAFKRLVLGSVSDVVAHRWTGAVMVVRPPATAVDIGHARKVESVMTRNPSCAQIHERVDAVAGLMEAHDTGFIPILDGDRLVGVVTDRDLAIRVLAARFHPGGVSVGEVCTYDPAWVAPEMPLSEAVTLMERRRVRRLVVMEGPKVVGVVSLGDLAETYEKAADHALVSISRSPKTLAHRAKAS